MVDKLVYVSCLVLLRAGERLHESHELIEGGGGGDDSTDGISASTFVATRAVVAGRSSTDAGRRGIRRRYRV